jgi:hypothetical protein
MTITITDTPILVTIAADPPLAVQIGGPPLVVEIAPPSGPGLSAYQLAVSQGFEGTLSEWLDSLAAPPGSGVVPGPGLQLVGEELRYAISTLSRA